MLIQPKIKNPSISPKKHESPKKKLNFSENDKNTINSGYKRKISPTKTPENKKFKVNSVQSPDTQVSNIIFY